MIDQSNSFNTPNTNAFVTAVLIDHGIDYVGMERNKNCSSHSHSETESDYKRTIVERKKSA